MIFDARMLLQHELREQRGHEVARHEVARVVDEEAAVGVAVEGDPELGLLLQHLADHELAVLGQQRVRLVVREAPVELEEVGDGVDREPLEDRRQHRARHPVRRVDHDAQRLHRAGVDEGQDLLDVARKDIFLPDLSWGLTPGHVGKGHGAVADLQQARVAADGQGSAADDLHARVLLRVVRSRDLDAAVQVEVADREIDHLGAHEPDVDHVGARRGRSFDHRLGHRRRGEPHVAPDRDLLRLELLDVGAADRVAALLVELRRVDAAHVVGLENLRIEHARDAKRPPIRSYT